MPPMEKHVIHISEAEAARDFAAVLARVRAGAEIVIEGREPIVVVRAGEVRAGARPVALRIHRAGQSPCRRAALRTDAGSGLRSRSGRDR